jgi:hypothetical protein
MQPLASASIPSNGDWCQVDGRNGGQVEDQGIGDQRLLLPSDRAFAILSVVTESGRLVPHGI